MKIKPYFKWFYIWIGLFIDTKKKILYVGLLPMIGIEIKYALDKTNNSNKGEAK